MQQIGIIGAGSVGGALGKLWAAKGHEIIFGMRDTSHLRGDAQEAVEQHGAQTGNPQQAVDFGEVVVLAIPANAVQETVSNLSGWENKIVIDANNRFGPSESGLSLAEDTAKWAAGARVVKAFNTLGANRFAKPDFNGQSASMFICGDDADAKMTVTGLTAELGFDVVDTGPLSQAGLLETMARLWVSMVRQGYGRDMAFKLLRD